MSLSYNHLALDVQLSAFTCFVGLLLCESDVGVHQAARNTATTHTHTATMLKHFTPVQEHQMKQKYTFMLVSNLTI